MNSKIPIALVGFLMRYLVSDCSVGKFESQVGKKGNQVGKFDGQVGKIELHELSIKSVQMKSEFLIIETSKRK